MRVVVTDVVFRYPSGVQALAGVSLEIAAGEAVAIIGENGAGKTTLARHLNGLLRPQQGRGLIGDWDTREHTVAQLAHRVGYVFQNPDDQLFERTVRRELAFGPRNLGRSEAEIQAAVARTLAKLGLDALAESHPYDLSLAQRRLVAMAAVLAMETPIVVLDEPTTGQDAAGTALLGRVIADLRAEGRTVIVISHDMDFVAEHFPRLIVMADGRILADGPTEAVLAQTGLLAQAQIDPPQLVRLAAALGLPGIPTTVDAFLALWARARATGGLDRV
ncbi:MAG: energy-coupling factor ABC transporter ATP-binding protein [Caldilineales bacterium]|nr:energy-coupling factor ABC transporter ATP-binding protein [Caldilineales bacterium]